MIIGIAAVGLNCNWTSHHRTLVGILGVSTWYLRILLKTRVFILAKMQPSVIVVGKMINGNLVIQGIRHVKKLLVGL